MTAKLMNIQAVGVDVRTRGPVFILGEVGGNRRLPIYIALNYETPSTSFFKPNQNQLTIVSFLFEAYCYTVETPCLCLFLCRLKFCSALNLSEDK